MVFDGGNREGSARPGEGDRTEKDRGSRIESLIRFAFRTGRYVIGATGCRIEAGRRKTGVLLIASDMNRDRAEHITRWAGESRVTVYSPLSGARMAALTGRNRCEILYVYDKSLAGSIGNELGEGHET